jgi:hypothetical protein
MGHEMEKLFLGEFSVFTLNCEENVFGGIGIWWFLGFCSWFHVGVVRGGGDFVCIWGNCPVNMDGVTRRPKKNVKGWVVGLGRGWGASCFDIYHKDVSAGMGELLSMSLSRRSGWWVRGALIVGGPLLLLLTELPTCGSLAWVHLGIT